MKLQNIWRKKLIELQGEINKSAIIVSYSSTLLFVFYRRSRKEISKDLVDQPTVNKLDLMDICRPTMWQEQNTHFFKCTSYSINHILNPITSLNQYKRIQIIPCIFYEYNGLNYKSIIKTSGKSPHIWKLRNTHLNIPWVKDYIKRM